MNTLSSANFIQGNTLLKEHTQMMNNKIILHSLVMAIVVDCFLIINIKWCFVCRHQNLHGNTVPVTYLQVA